MTRTPADAQATKAFNATIADEFLANDGKVGGAVDGDDLYPDLRTRQDVDQKRPPGPKERGSP